MVQPSPSPVVHLELHSGNLARARSFYSQVCGWRIEQVEAGHRSYEGGIVECDTSRPLWIPYLEISQIEAATELARRFGASVLLEPREGPAGWRSVVAVPDGGEIGFWQSKTPAIR
jgi:predicted enzyme related to lactoylglutathione lyase